MSSLSCQTPEESYFQLAQFGLGGSYTERVQNTIRQETSSIAPVAHLFDSQFPVDISVRFFQEFMHCHKMVHMPRGNMVILAGVSKCFKLEELGKPLQGSL